MWRKWAFIGIGTLGVVAAIILTARTAPAYSLWWFRLALETRDVRNFDYWVDADAVVLDLAKAKVARLHGQSSLAVDPSTQPTPEAVALLPEMGKVYRRDIRAYLMGMQPDAKPVDRTYLMGEIVRNGPIAETTLTPDLPRHKPWRVRLLQQSGGLWKVISLTPDS